MSVCSVCKKWAREVWDGMEAAPDKTYEPLTPDEIVQLAAPHTWPASVLPAIFGILYCIRRGFYLSPPMGLALLAICVLMQSGVNTINDFFDYIKGTDTSEDNLEETDAVLLYHSLNPWHVLSLGMGFLSIAALLGLWVVWQSGPAPLLAGLIGGAAVLLYSGGPQPLSYLPIGECISGGVMGGLIPAGILAAASGGLHWEVIPFSLPFILGIGLMMMSNNGCDIDKDRAAGRLTLPVLLGRQKTVILYRAIVWLWLAFICFFSWLLAGNAGFLALMILILFGRKPFAWQVRTRLLMEERITQMKTIQACNVAGNGAYLAAFAAALLLQCL